jgi:hypothetical protein
MLEYFLSYEVDDEKIAMQVLARYTENISTRTTAVCGPLRVEN